MKHVTQRKARRSVMSLVCSAGAAAAVLFGGAVSNASAAATLTPLGFLGAGTSGFTLSLARGVSANGSTVVGYSETASVDEAFRWTAGSGMVGLGFGDAFGNSGDGSTIVGRYGSEAFRWTSASGMVGLGDSNRAGCSRRSLAPAGTTPSASSLPARPHTSSSTVRTTPRPT